jgi:hypothetical protein
MTPSRHYRIHLRPLQDDTDPDGVRRLRSLLKIALRSLRLKCVFACTATSSQERPWPADAAPSTSQQELFPDDDR